MIERDSNEQRHRERERERDRQIDRQTKRERERLQPHSEVRETLYASALKRRQHQ